LGQKLDQQFQVFFYVTGADAGNRVRDNAGNRRPLTNFSILNVRNDENHVEDMMFERYKLTLEGIEH
jgi:hypothetical protein